MLHNRDTWLRLRQVWRKSFVQNTLWLLAGQGLGVLFQAAYFIILARVLGTREYGIYVGAFAFSNIIAVYSPLGTGTIFLRYVSGNTRSTAEYFGNILIATSAVSGVLILGLTISASHMINRASAHLVLLSSVANCLFSQLSIEIARIFQTFEKMKLTATLNLQVSALRTAAALTILVTFRHATAFQWTAVATAVSGAAAAAAIVLAIANFGWPRIDFRVFRRHIAEGLGFSFASSTTNFYNDLDKAMLSHYNMNFGNGIYSMAYRLVDIASMPLFAMRDAAMPRLFQLGRQEITKAADYGRILNRRSLLIGSISSLGLFLCAPIIPKLVGTGFAESVVALRWLALIPVFRCIHQMSGIVLTSAGRQGIRTVAQVLAAGLNFALNLWLIPSHGWIGASWASLATDGALAAMNWGTLQIILQRCGSTLTPVDDSAPAIP